MSYKFDTTLDIWSIPDMKELKLGIEARERVAESRVGKVN